MTNIISPEIKNKRLLTPERSVILIPVLVGIFVTFFIGIFAVYPLIKYKNENFELLQLNRLKKSKIYKLRNDYQILKNNLKYVNKQKNTIINMIAGEKEIQTIMAKLSWLSNEHSLEIKEVKTNPIQKNIPLPKNSQTSPSSYKKISDPFLFDRTEKHSSSIRIEGEFEGFINFLKDLELLENLVLIDEIEINRLTSKDGNTSTSQEDAKSKIKAKLKLFIYGRIPSESNK